MAIKTRDELIAQISARIGEDTSDEAIALIEDVTDTFDDLSGRANGDGTDWKAEYERNDKEWREKYVARFSSTSDDKDDKVDDKGGNEKEYTYENLFN